MAPLPESHNFDVASQRNKSPRPHRFRFKPYQIRGTQEPQCQLLPQLPSTVCPQDLYINKNFIPSGWAPKAGYETTSTFGAGSILGPQSMQMTIQPASVSPLTDAPVMQAQLPTLPEDATHWPAFHLPKDLQATIMPQNPMVQSMKRKVVGADEEEKQPRICPDEDPEFQMVIKDGAKLYRNQKKRNQKKSHGFAAADLATSNFAVPPTINLPQGPFTYQGTGPAAQQAPPSFVLESNFSSGPAVQPVIQAPRPNSMTHEVTPFAEDIIPPEAPPDVRFSAQAPDEQYSTTIPHQPSSVPLLPIAAEGGIDLFGSPVSVAPASHVYSESALDSLVLPSSSRFAAAEAYWKKKLEELIHESPNDLAY
ncbi:hypothetical protein P692DRAFT_20878062 [Suillus brevipes Sb2]|nr:hypothetical protein P692DRAFT_20878062 [Suillus brevipes Sb2]